MKTDYQNNIAFKTRIRIVDNRRFQAITKGLKRKSTLIEITHWNILENDPLFKSYAINANNIQTKFIRTCTGILIANKGKKASLFGHFYHSQENIQASEQLEPHIKKGSNAIIIGSKSIGRYSRELFDTLRDKVRKKHIPLTLMKFEDVGCEGHMAYAADNDELYLCIHNVDTHKCVQNMEDLKKAMGTLKISEADTIEFETRPKNFWVKIKNLFK